MSSKPTRGIGPVPEGLSVDLADFLGQVRRIVLDVGADRLLTGTAARRAGTGVFGGGGSGGGDVGTGGTTTDPEPDLTAPPDVSGLAVTSGFAQVMVQFDAPVFTQGHGPKRTIIYAVKVVSTDPTLPTFPGEAGRVYECPEALNIVSLPSDLGIRWHVWAKHETNDGVKSVSPAGGTNGVSATTGKIGTSDLGPLIIEAGNIKNGVLDGTKFASGLEPIGIVTSIPGAKTQSTIFNVTDGKLYYWDVATTSYKVNIAGAATSVNAADIIGLVTSAQIASLAAAKLSGTITTTQIADDAITTPKILAGAVTATQIAANTILAGNIAAGQITGAKIAALTIQASNIVAGTITGNEIAANSVNADRLVANSITTGKIQAGAITVTELAANAVTAIKIQAGAIAVGTAAIADGAIINAMIANATIDTAKIANLDAAKITTGTLDANRIGALSITAGKISTTSLSALSTNLGYCTAGEIHGGKIHGGGFTSFAWPSPGLSGFYLGPEGLLLGNFLNGRYVNIDAIGDFYAPGLSIVSGAATFSGSISVGGATWANGVTGFWAGMDGGAAKLRVGSSTQYLKYDGTSLTIKLDSFTASISGSLTVSVANGEHNYGSKSVSTSGGAGSNTYDWSVGSLYSGNDGQVVSAFVSGGQGTATASFSGAATNNQVIAYVTCKVTDANGRVATAGFNIFATHGTYIP